MEISPRRHPRQVEEEVGGLLEAAGEGLPYVTIAEWFSPVE